MEFSGLRLVIISFFLASLSELGSTLVSNEAHRTTAQPHPGGPCVAPIKVVETFHFGADDLRQLKELHIRHNLKVNYNNYRS